MGARLAGTLPPGAACTLMVRPERVALSPGSALRARLSEVLFQGDHVRLRLTLPGGAEIVAKRPVGDGALPEPGTEAGIGWAPEHARALPGGRARCG